MAAETVITLPFEEGFVWTALGLALVLIASALVWAALPKPDDTGSAAPEDWRKPLGISAVPEPLAIAGAILWGLLTLGLIYGLIRTLLWLSVPALRGDAGLEAGVDWRFTLITLAGLTATLGAVVALPVTLNRLKLTREQTLISSESVITERLKSAFDNLGANDPAVRMGAIHLLDRIMNDSPNERVMILRTLEAFLQHRQHEVSPASSADVTTGKTAPNALNVDIEAAVDVLLRWR